MTLQFNEIPGGSITIDPRSVPVQHRVNVLMSEGKMCNRCALLAAGKDPKLAQFIEDNCDKAINRATETMFRTGVGFYRALDKAWKELGAQFSESPVTRPVESARSDCPNCK